MNGLIRFSLGNPRAITVLMLTVVLAGGGGPGRDPGRHPAGLQQPRRAGADVLRRHARDQRRDGITTRMERWTGQAAGTIRQESRSIVGASIVRNYFADDVDPTAP